MEPNSGGSGRHGRRAWPLAFLALGLSAPAYATDITLWHAWRGDERAVLEAVTADYQAAHPGDHVELVFVPYESLGSKVEAAVPRGNGPDLFVFAHEKLDDWVHTGVVQAVGPADALQDPLHGALTEDHQLYGWPLASKCLALFYNRALVPTPPATTDELLTLAETLRDDAVHPTRWGFAWEATSAYQNAAWMHGFGGGVFANGVVRLDRPENLAAFEFIQKLAALGPAETSGSLVTQLFNEGKVAMVPNGPWFLGEIEPQERGGPDFAVAPLPIVSSTGLPAAPYLTVEALFLARSAHGENAGTADQEALARDFAAYLQSDAVADRRAVEGRQVVPRHAPAIAPAPADGSAAITPAPADGSAAIAPAPADGSAAIAPAPADGSAAIAPAPADGSAAIAPAPADGSAAITPAPADGSAAIAPAPADGSAAITPAPADGSAAIAPAPADGSALIAPAPVEDPLLAAFQTASLTAVPMPTTPAMAQTWEPLARAFRRLVRGAATPGQAAAEAQTTWTVVSRPEAPTVDGRPYAAVLAVGLLAAAGWLIHQAYSLRIWRHWREYLWIAPGGLAVALLVIAPFLVGASVSLFEVAGSASDGSWRFIGFAHFLDILLARDFQLTDPSTRALSFWYTLAVTIVWTVANVVLHVGIGVFLAMMLREPWVRLRGFFRAALILPWAIPNYITALAWKGMFHQQFGAINAVLALLGIQPVSWFASWSTAFAANVATNTWLGFPFMMVVTLGALQSIPREVEEAAEMDGASGWQRFRLVTLPMLKPALLPAVILGSVWTFNMFNVIYLVSGGEPDGSTDILVSQAYRWAFTRGHRYGYGAAYAVIIFGVMLVQSRVLNRLAGKKVV